MTMSGEARGRRVVVTGAGSGIGRAVAARLLDEGASVVAMDLAPDHSAAGDADGRLLPVRCDVRDESSVSAAFDTASEFLGGMDGLVTCAGVTDGSPTAEMTLQSWETVLGVNLTGTFLCVRAALPSLLDGEDPAVVTVGSVGSLVAAGRSPAYDASKGGVLALTRGLAAEYADRGLRANCVCPGLVDTGLAGNSSARAGLDPVARSGVPGRVVPPIRRAAAPTEIADVVTFLLSSRASFVTGAAYPVDGGYSAV
ncbi:SDR family NAD(P)-dependent oxidoreductase [Pseudonocardia parietis]|uniref:NAD(P)-dependent dehydrogenase (Short-subunit alcohol dehydrogenase family) n=1 Tax=Pseudonocardia parietis TaxID=570936 RepID=A0ABS4VZW6_9PSEU|nr:SDR family NAD(P)-dependent oxidoreductase [Pseudonocardia parietis]MBP2369475.1 NAD(P)-dependent dehydrogenase (short-subunit alcohol dehydrogenase family) [Pseudonocardia parietis]